MRKVKVVQDNTENSLRRIFLWNKNVSFQNKIHDKDYTERAGYEPWLTMEKNRPGCFTVQRRESVHALNEQMNEPRELSSGQLNIHKQISNIYFLFLISEGNRKVATRIISLWPLSIRDVALILQCLFISDSIVSDCSFTHE